MCFRLHLRMDTNVCVYMFPYMYIWWNTNWGLSLAILTQILGFCVRSGLFSRYGPPQKEPKWPHAATACRCEEKLCGVSRHVSLRRDAGDGRGDSGRRLRLGPQRYAVRCRLSGHCHRASPQSDQYIFDRYGPTATRADACRRTSTGRIAYPTGRD